MKAAHNGIVVTNNKTGAIVTDAVLREAAIQGGIVTGVTVHYLNKTGSITTYNQYTGRHIERKVINITASGNAIVLERSEWLTGEMRMTYRPTEGAYVNEYAGERITLAHP